MKAIVLAGGACSRFWPLAGATHKTMYEVGSGKPVLWYTVSGLIDVGINELIIVVGSHDQAIPDFFGDGSKWGGKIDYIVQPQPLGAGEGILRSKELLSPKENFLVVNGSQVNAFLIAAREKRSMKLLSDRVILFGQKTAIPENYGIMELHHDRVMRIVEKPKIDIGNVRILEVYALPHWFLEDLAKFEGEHSLEMALASVIDKELGITGIVMNEKLTFPSLKFPWDLLEMNRFLMGQWNIKGIEKEDGPIEIHPSALIYGPVVIQRGVKIMEGAVIKGPCFIGEGATIGTYAIVRDHCYIGCQVMVGEYSKVKNSLLYDRASLHDNFVGDSVLDRGCHLGVGMKTANSKLKNASHKNIRSDIKGQMVDTGREKLGMIVGADSSLGIGVNAFPGIKIGQRVQVWPGTILNADIPDDYLCRPSDVNVTVPRRMS